MIERRESRFGLGWTESRFQSADNGQPIIPVVVEPIPVRRHLGLHRDGDEDVRRLPHLHTRETGPRYSDDGHPCSVYDDRLVQNPWVSAKVARPIAVAQDN